jgi:hypothetical protein
MNKLTYFAILCLFSAAAFANDASKEIVMPRSRVVLAPEANTKYAGVLSRSVIKARLDNIGVSQPGHVLITQFEKLGRGNVADEYIAHGVWVR